MKGGDFELDITHRISTRYRQVLKDCIKVGSSATIVLRHEAVAIEIDLTRRIAA